MESSSRVPGRVWLFLAMSVMAGSQSGNIIRLGHASPVAIAAWRLLLASLLLLPLAAPELHTLRGRSKGAWLLTGLAGLALAGHFFAWIGAVQNTTVANAALLFSVNPVLSAIAGWLLFGDRVGARLLASLVLGSLGVAVVTLGDVHFRREQLVGDALGALSALLFTSYTLLGRRLRRDLANVVYVTALYGTAAVVAFSVLIARGEPIFAYDARTWLCFALMALVPTMIGHTGINNALQWLSAARVAMVLLFDPLVAGMTAAFFWDEPLTSRVLWGFALLAASALVLYWRAQPKS